MAAQLWRSVLGLQTALAVAIVFAAWLLRGAPRPAHPWLGLGFAALCFVALQYLQVFGILALSRALAPRSGSADRSGAWRAMLTEPVYFGLAQFSMARGARAPRDAGGGAAPVLLVHGLACNAGVWSRLIPRLRAAGFAPIRAVQLTPFGEDIDALAHRLARELAELHAQARAPVTVVAHSLGGLVSRAALREVAPQVVRRLVTVGTPHHGAALARLSHAPPVGQMRPDCGWLAELNARQASLPVPVTSLFSLDDNFVTPPRSAELEGARSQALRGLGHFGLLVSRRGTDGVLRALQEAA